MLFGRRVKNCSIVATCNHVQSIEILLLAKTKFKIITKGEQNLCSGPSRLFHRPGRGKNPNQAVM